MTTQSKDPNYITTEFLVMLLRQIWQVYYDNTEDWAAMHALDIVTAAIEADEKMNEESAETVLEYMSHLADWMLGNPEFSPAIRVRLEAIRNTHPDFAEPATTGVAS